MTLFILAYFGGMLTVISPCILPVLPFVFSRSDRPFLTSGLPMLCGMAITFAVVATLAAVGGGWAVAANQYGREIALAVLALFGITLLIPSIADRAMRPLVALGERISVALNRQTEAQRPTLLLSLLLGVATGLLWAPCAGPLLGLILTEAALQGATLHTSLLLLLYAAGAATSLALALLVGGRVFVAMKKSLGAGEWIRRGLGALVLVAVVAISLGVDTGFLTQLSLSGSSQIEQALLDRFAPKKQPTEMADRLQHSPAMMAADGIGMVKASSTAPAADLPFEGSLPSLAGAVTWLNSPPLTAAGLKGKVVLIDFWTYSCINCIRTLPYVEAWAEKYKDQGLVVIGVHAPEFAFEKNVDNVRRAIAEFGIHYPVAIDNDYAIWRGFNNEYWPAHYFIDAQGRIRHHHFGEGNYAESEHVIQELLAEAGQRKVAGGVTSVAGSGAEAASDDAQIESPETYVGYERAENFVSPGGAADDVSHRYVAPSPGLNEWALSGDWTVGGQNAVLDRKGGGIVYRFHARDLHLVLGPTSDGKPVHFQVTLDGKSPGNDHGVDTDERGDGVVSDQRLYQLVRQSGSIADRTFEIHFLDPGVHAYAFTFG